VNGKRVAAIEILLNTQYVSDLILKGEIHGIKEAMEKSENIGMQTFDLHLQRLYEEGKITLEDALANSDSPNNLRLKISLASKSPQTEDVLIDGNENDVKLKNSGLNIQLVEMEIDGDDE
jgi:twitching motility protein PilU